MTVSAQDVNEFCHYATQTELDHIRAIAGNLSDGNKVVMLGAGPGVLLLSALEGNRELNTFVVDHDTVDYVLAHAQQCGLPKERINTRVCESVLAGQEWCDGPIALLIIDADHSYGGVTGDIIAWLPHLAVGGWVFFHDYDATGTEFADQPRYYGVMRAVDERVRTDPHYQFFGRAGTGITFRRVS